MYPYHQTKKNCTPKKSSAAVYYRITRTLPSIQKIQFRLQIHEIAKLSRMAEGTLKGCGTIRDRTGQHVLSHWFKRIQTRMLNVLGA